ncbi:ABC transporter substrate-binding protein [Paenibacillus harenae]|nr:extracellular solute-binding protein [Paenibacillus harenae]
MMPKVEESIIADEGKSTDPETLTIRLVSSLGSRSNKHHLLAQRIEQFDEEHPEVEIKIEWVQSYDDPSDAFKRTASWFGVDRPVELYKEAQIVPDIIELVPNQMRGLYRLGKIEPLNMNESELGGYVIESDEGRVLGIKSKISPMIVYFNQSIFESIGLETPSREWDLNQLTGAIMKLKEAGHDIYIPLTPYTLEWATSMHGGRIVSVDGTTFSGYIDSEEAVKAAEWIVANGTNLDIFMNRPSAGNIILPMPLDLIEGTVALAIDYAHGLYNSLKSSYEDIVQHNEQIGIAGLPVGATGVNPAQVSGLSLTSQSAHKDTAMKLLRYLTSDRSSLYSDIATYTLQEDTIKLGDPVNAERKSLVEQEMSRSVPAALYMHEANTTIAFQEIWLSSPKALRAIQDGHDAGEALKRYKWNWILSLVLRINYGER